MNTEKWKKICFLLNEDIQKDISEKSFEEKVIQALDVLGWEKYLGDIEVRPSIKIGSNNRIEPDFVIKTNGKKIFTIEIKRPSVTLNFEFQKQLFSYMRQLKLEYGLIIGESIQIFYDGALIEHDDPVLLDTIKFDRNNKKGENFIKLFSKENLKTTMLQDFTLEALKQLTRKKDFNKLTNFVLSEAFNTKLIELVKQHFISEYDNDLINSVLNELSIKIKTKYKQSNEIIFGINKQETKRTAKRKVDGMKIGKFVQHSFRVAFSQNLISEEEIEKLQNANYSKENFNSNLTILRSVNISPNERL